jgi:CopA family copper-resistance protein
MKKLVVILFVLSIRSLVSAQDMKGMDMSKKEHKEHLQPTTYTCSMHPEIHSAKPGNCPKCGMKLIKEQPKKTMKPEVVQPDVKKMLPKESHENTMDMGRGDMPKVEMGTIKTTINHSPPRTVRYDLYIADTTVNFSGKKSKHAIAVNGQIPMPTLTFTEGDTAEIYVHNNLNESTSLHWHGLFLPNEYDGVPNLTQMPIKPHTVHLYRFPIIQHGTHWYHSHSGLQEQIGMYGALIINRRSEWAIPTMPIVLSDWTDMNAKQVNRNLHNASDWFAVRKGSTQSYAEAIKDGYLKTKVTNEWKRMNAMDVSDVYYEKFLINGKNQNEYTQYRAGDKVRLRIANGSASSYFWLTWSGGKITVVATDGNDVEPVEVDRLIIAVSETYDIVITIPENKNYEFLATAEDRTRSASLWVGSGEKVPANALPRLKYFAGMKMMNSMMDMRGNLVSMGMKMSNQKMDMNMVMYPEMTGDESAMGNVKYDTTYSMRMDGETGNRATNNRAGNKGNERKETVDMSSMTISAHTDELVTLNYSMLRSPEKTTLPDNPVKVLQFDLTGNMNRYVWTLDNKTISESDRILIKKDENVRVILYNNSMMRHPMHLHGHDFRVLNGHGAYAPMKNVIDLMPMERDTIEFAASEYGDWFFHCHILYHMMSGMGRVFRYEDSPPNPEIPRPEVAQRRLNWDDRMPHVMARIGLESNGSDGMAMLANTRYKAQTIWHLGMKPEHGYESETTVGRYLGRMQWWHVFVGFDYHYKKLINGIESETGTLIGKNIFGSDYKNMLGQISNKSNRKTAMAGVQYTIPMLIIAELRADLEGKVRFQLSRDDIPVTRRLRLGMMANTDKEYVASLRYIATKYLSVSSHYDSDMGLGAGVTITY